MGGFFTTLFAKIAAVVKWVSDLWVAIFVAAWDLLKDGFSWLFDQVLSVAVAAITAIDLSGITSQAWGTIPGDIGNILSLLGVGTAITMITAAITIRIGLQLIPFVRLGS
jgi:hypothetical protein